MQEDAHCCDVHISNHPIRHAKFWDQGEHVSFFLYHLYILSFINEGIWLMIPAFVVPQVEIKNLNASSPLSWKVDYESIKTVTSLQPGTSRLDCGKKELR